MKYYFSVFMSPAALFSANLSAQDTIENYIKEYPNQQQVKMMKAWLAKNEKGTFQFTGLVDPTEGTVVTPQATVDYGYNWFSLSEGPAIIRTPKYDKFFSVSIFDMKHNVPAVIVNPDKPMLDSSRTMSQNPTRIYKKGQVVMRRSFSASGLFTAVDKEAARP